MRTIETFAEISSDRLLTLQMPPEISPGKHKIVLVIEEKEKPLKKQSTFSLPKLRIKNWSDDISLSRKELYGDDGR